MPSTHFLFRSSLARCDASFAWKETNRQKPIVAGVLRKKSKRLYFVGFRVWYKGKSTRFPNIKAPGAKRLLVNDSNDGRALRNIHLVGAPHTPCVEIPYLEKNHEMIFEANSKNE